MNVMPQKCFVQPHVFLVVVSKHKGPAQKNVKQIRCTPAREASQSHHSLYSIFETFSGVYGQYNVVTPFWDAVIQFRLR